VSTLSTMDALLDAARDRLRAALELAPEECSVTPDGKPDPDCGERFVAIHPGGVSNSQQHCLDEYYAFRATVTVRTGQDPRDRRRDGGAWALALKVRAALHMSYDVTALANAADPDVSFVEPPVFEGGTYLGPQGGEWFFADPDGGADPTGVAVELSFGKARHVMYIEEQEDRS